MNLAGDLETTFGREFSQKALDNYRGWRSWGQLNESLNSVSNDACECCAHVRRNLVQTALKGGVLFWLADAKKLHDARGAKRLKEEKACGFCNIIYQQFWAWQSPVYRLKSHLWAKTLREMDEGEQKFGWIEIKKLWDSLIVDRANGSMVCHSDALGNFSRSCKTTTCNICFQDEQAKLDFGELDLLCEACRNVGGNDHLGLRPAIPLVLRPTILSDGTSLPTLGVKHAAGVRANNGTAQEWRWAMYTDADDKAAAVLPSFHRASYDHEGVYSQIKAWRESCKDHATCQTRRSRLPRLPDRVLELNDGKCRLRDTRGKYGDYVALSYCWGAAQPEQLLDANLAPYKEHIEVEKLPKTIQQALVVTHKLGFSYLWVDSMCIIQDNKHDKLFEIRNMRNVYAQSQLTICASGARNCNEGFFDTARAPGTSVRTPDIGINFPCTLPDGSTGHVRLIERAQYRPQAEALTWRAWTYQEELLPTSVVRFGACLSWECDEVSESRTLSSLTGGIDAKVPFSLLYGDTDSDRHDMRRTLHDIFADFSSRSSGKYPDVPPNRALCPTIERPSQDHNPTYMMHKCTCEDGPFFAAWQKVVADYTARNLTNPADKLLALSGVTDAFGKVHENGYYFGLWPRRIVHDMMWKTNPLPRAPDGKSRRRRDDFAPSWSWACLDSVITVVGAHNRILGCNLDNCTLVSQKATAQLIDVSLDTSSGSGPYLDLTKGSITINAPMVKLRLVKGDYLVMLRIEGTQLQVVSDSFTKISHPSDFASPHMDLNPLASNPDLEGLGDPKDGIEVWCVQMREEVVQSTRVFPGQDKPVPVILMDGLILLPARSEPGAFRRIGVWVTEYRGILKNEESPFHGIAPQDVKIV